MERLDCAVIGSGLYGLAAAKQYQSTHPDDALVIYEASSSLGGTWSKQRIYPNLKTNNLLGTFEYPDFPFDPEAVNLRPGKDHIPGETCNAYFTAYAKHFGVDRLIQFNTKVTVAEHQDTDQGGWVLTLESKNGSQPVTTKVFTRRLIMATGLTSEPIDASFVGQDTYGGQIFHPKQFADLADTLKTAKNATVYGTGKSAWDIAYSYATAGVPVNWVIRSTGHGLGWVTVPRVSPFKLWLEKLAHTRLMTWFSPSIWGETDGFSWIQRFLHGTWIGRLLVSTVWKIISADVIELCGFDKHPETAKLKAWIPLMYTATSLSILNYDQDFLELVRSGKIKIHVADIERLSPGLVHLSNGTTLESDILMAYGGWQQSPPLKFLPEGIEAELGLPHSQSNTEWDPDNGEQAKLIKRADSEILSRLPMLRNQPQFPNFVRITKQDGAVVRNPKPQSGYMLYRFMAPQSARLLRYHDIAFTGMTYNLSIPTTAHIGGLWISAYLDGKLAHNPSAIAADKDAFEKLRYENVLYNRFGHWRHPVDWGYKAPCFVFDTVAYLSILLRDLGLKTHRKGGLFKEIVGAYGVEDYRNVNDEWEEAHAAKSKED